jgi:hypothetical protein
VPGQGAALLFTGVGVVEERLHVQLCRILSLPHSLVHRHASRRSDVLEGIEAVRHAAWCGFDHERGCRHRLGGGISGRGFRPGLDGRGLRCPGHHRGHRVDVHGQAFRSAVGRRIEAGRDAATESIVGRSEPIAEGGGAFLGQNRTARIALGAPHHAKAEGAPVGIGLSSTEASGDAVDAEPVFHPGGDLLVGELPAEWGDLVIGRPRYLFHPLRRAVRAAVDRGDAVRHEDRGRGQGGRRIRFAR